MSTRAIHLEQVEEQSAEYFLFALKRFCSRRGVPKQILSETAGALKLLMKLSDIVSIH